MRARARRKRPEEHVDHERWAIPYGDLITLLLALFVVLYSMSVVDERKFRELASTLFAVFDGTPKRLEPLAVGVESLMPPPEEIHETPIATPPEGRGEIDQIGDLIEQALAHLIEDELITVHRGDFWVKIEINTAILFASGSAMVESDAVPVMRSIAEVLRQFPNAIDVEGHTDDVPIQTPVFPSNWELSAGRAASVVHLFMNAGIDPRRMTAIGHGEQRPVGDNRTAAGRAENRRVVIVVQGDHDTRWLREGGQP